MTDPTGWAPTNSMNGSGSLYGSGSLPPRLRPAGSSVRAWSLARAADFVEPDALAREEPDLDDDALDPEDDGRLEVGVVDAACFEPRRLRLASETARRLIGRSEEHTSELQSLMRISYAVFCLKKKKNKKPELC